MQIIIGRESKESRLMLKVDGKQNVLGAANTVPSTVSREHIQIDVDANGVMMLKNLKQNNITYVNGAPTETQVINLTDRVELGPERHSINLKELIGKILPKPQKKANISHLKQVWDTYDNKQKEFKKKMDKLNQRQMIIPMISIGGMGLVGGVFNLALDGGAQLLQIPLYIIIIGFMAWNFMDRKKEMEHIDLEKEHLKDWFQKNYVCPLCGRFIGFRDYDLIYEGDQCATADCRAKFDKGFQPRTGAPMPPQLPLYR